jgi:lactate racemase
MVDVWLPYGKTDVCLRVPARNLLGHIEPNERKGVPDTKAEIERAIRNPIGSQQLSEIAKPVNSVAIVIDHVTRKIPSEVMLLAVLAELNVAGVKDENVTVIFGCGINLGVKPEEVKELFSEEVLKRVKIVSHDCRANDLVYAGTTKTHSNKVYLNRVFAEADVKVLLSEVGFHYYAGYDGGRKSVINSVSGEETIKHNQSLLMHSNARTGILEHNPVHQDMTEAARLSRVDFIINIVRNNKGEIIKAFAGDLEQAFTEAVKTFDEMYRINIERRADIVVISAGGHPMDVNLYQALRALDNALDVVKRGGVIILVAECPEGHGNQVFYDWMTRLSDFKSVEREIKRNFAMGAHKAYSLLKTLQSHPIILVSSLPDYYATSIFKLKTARAINDAFNEALRIAGSVSRVWTIPQGNIILPQFKAQEEIKV